jgi:glycosyltransferase involved in cell wall biosynthesis
LTSRAVKTMAIVSSFSESCGNAAFTQILKDSIAQFTDFSVDVVELDLSLLQSVDHPVRRAADKHIQELSNRLAKYDAVNIQMEAGLYGTYPSDISKRFKKLLGANSNTSVTMHSPRILSATNSGARSGLKKIAFLQLKSGLKELIASFYGNLHTNLNKKILKIAMIKNAPIIVHTARAKKQIAALFNYSNVVVHPLRLVPPDFSPNAETYNQCLRSIGVKETDIVIGIFGYISAYKGHTDALTAIKLLPEKFKLLIMGRQHPQTLKADGRVDTYLEKLMKQIEREKLNNRVFFMGELSDPEFLNMAANVDLTWMPYYENGQDGSGIASICLDLCPRVICSSSFAFDELFKLIPYSNVKRFDVGNYLQLAQQSLFAMNCETAYLYGDRNQQFSLESQAKLYATVVSPS